MREKLPAPTTTASRAGWSAGKGTGALSGNFVTSSSWSEGCAGMLALLDSSRETKPSADSSARLAVRGSPMTFALTVPDMVPTAAGLSPAIICFAATVPSGLQIGEGSKGGKSTMSSLDSALKVPGTGV